MKLKTQKEVEDCNELVRISILNLRKEIEDIEKLITDAKNDLIPPCKFCRYDGVCRCEACEEMGFIGFNIADFPQNDDY